MPSKDELVERAKELGIAHSSLNKDELTKAIEAAEEQGDAEEVVELEATTESAADAAIDRIERDAKADADFDVDRTIAAEEDAPTDPVEIAEIRAENEARREQEAEGIPEDASKADLLEIASEREIPGRSNMTVEELRAAITDADGPSGESASERADRVAHAPRTEGNNPVAVLHERVVDRQRTIVDDAAVRNADSVEPGVATVEQHATIDVLPDATKPADDATTAANRRHRGAKVGALRTFRYRGTEPRLEGREVPVNEDTPTFERLSNDRDWEQVGG